MSGKLECWVCKRNNMANLENNDYVRSHEYEHYIRAARLCRRDQFGAHNQEMLNVMWLEKDGYITDERKHYKFLKKVKENLLEATEYALNKHYITEKDKQILRSFIPRINQAAVSEELLQVCSEGLDLLEKYNPNS